jgi:hypothetical protein
VPIDKHAPGIRTRVLLLISLALIIAFTTASSLYIIRSQLRRQVLANLEKDLGHSVETFQDLEAGRLAALERENALMAALPSLKALMTTNDPRTIEDDAADFWKTSGNDLFALADSDHRVQTAYALGTGSADALKRDLQTVIADPTKHYLLTSGRLFEYSVRPLYFGSPRNGTLLGYVISGYAIDQGFLREVGRGAGAEAAFFEHNAVIVSTLPKERQDALDGMPVSAKSDGGSGIALLDGERYLTASKNLNGIASTPLQLVVMKSFDEADRAEYDINQLIFWVSFLVMAAGSVLMLILARMVTQVFALLARVTGSTRSLRMEPERCNTLAMNSRKCAMRLRRRTVHCWSRNDWRRLGAWQVQSPTIYAITLLRSMPMRSSWHCLHFNRVSALSYLKRSGWR